MRGKPWRPRTVAPVLLVAGLMVVAAVSVFSPTVATRPIVQPETTSQLSPATCSANVANVSAGAGSTALAPALLVAAGDTIIIGMEAAFPASVNQQTIADSENDAYTYVNTSAPDGQANLAYATVATAGCLTVTGTATHIYNTFVAFDAGVLGPYDATATLTQSSSSVIDITTSGTHETLIGVSDTGGLTWTAPAVDVGGVIVDSSGQADQLGETVDSGSSTAASMAFTTSYVYAMTVVAFRSAGPTAPPAPTGFQLDLLSSASATFIWTQSAGGGILNDTGYVFAGATCTGAAVRHLSTAGAATTVTATGLTPATEYSAHATSWNATGQSPASNCVTFTTDSPPFGIGGTSDDGSLTLSGVVLGAGETFVVAVASNITTYVGFGSPGTGLTNFGTPNDGTNTYVPVCPAYCYGGNSFGQVINYMQLFVTNAASAGTYNVHLTSAVLNMVAVAWATGTSLGPIDFVNVQDGYAPAFPHATSNVGTSGYNETVAAVDLANNGSIAWADPLTAAAAGIGTNGSTMSMAHAEHFGSPASSTWYNTTSENGPWLMEAFSFSPYPPDAPTGLGFNDLLDTTATATWNPAASQEPIANYTLYFFAGAGCQGTPAILSNGDNDTSYGLSGLSPETVYSGQVTAWNNLRSQSPPSACVSLEILYPSLAISDVTSGSFTESWGNGTWANVTAAVLVIGFGTFGEWNVTTLSTGWGWNWTTWYAMTDPYIGTGQVVISATNATTGFNSTFTPSETIWVGLLISTGDIGPFVFNVTEVTFLAGPPGAPPNNLGPFIILAILVTFLGSCIIFYTIYNGSWTKFWRGKWQA